MNQQQQLGYEDAWLKYCGEQGMHPHSAERDTFEAGYEASCQAAVHEAYVNAQRAVAVIAGGNSNNVSYQRGRQVMQEDAVRAIREAAEENR